jgi:hypothetical protein
MLNMRQILPLLIFCCCNIGCPVAQELNAAVTVNSSRIGGDRQLFDRLEQQLGSFINERKWMEEQGAADEKIDCSFTLLIHEMPSPSSFKCELLVQARRPVAGTTRKTTLLNYRESSLLFDYTDFQPLEFNPDHITSNLVATIAFYANLIIGLHSDSMTPLGGSASFRQMMAIANNVQFNHWSGWDMDDRGRNRYAIAALFNDPAFEDYRTMWYGYHREGLDEIAPIENALNKLKEAHKAQNIADIDACMAELNTAFQAASQEMYNAANAQAGGQQAGPQDFGGQQPGGNQSGSQQGDVTDVDFEEVK